ncbi:MAG: bis(5'-nucleosyl)-tetraphosphatase (symmetrical) ApaH [Candidatus Dasytiphilus stammeri]
MSTYLIGDVHGCYKELCILLNRVNFDPTKDILWLTGDLIARGPDSLKVLRYIRSLEKSVRLVLGNHDLHLIASLYGDYKTPNKKDLEEILKASDAEDLIYWLRHHPLLQIDEEKKIIMSHAGIYPQWDLDTAKECAGEVELMLASDDYLTFLHDMYNDRNIMLNSWSPNFKGIVRWQFITNVLTRMRYCFPQGQLDMICKDPPSCAPALLQPWFSLPNRILLSSNDGDYTIIFGHWASLNGQYTPNGIICLDTGCCWGGSLTMLCWERKTFIVQPCSIDKKRKR